MVPSLTNNSVPSCKISKLAVNEVVEPSVSCVEVLLIKCATAPTKF